jgi:hypothetical protein
MLHRSKGVMVLENGILGSASHRKARLKPSLSSS